ncbi:MAG TPA: hypothetical protein VJH22_05390 [Candidatus Nanoarchaeia archaeon]|nr:hypothetical protein [Candidatus Nanoarchaeia archaeon]
MRKAQVKMFETIGVLVVFFFLIVIGLAFFFVIAKKGAIEEYEKVAQLKGIEIVRKAVTLPELDCARVGVQVENCFDMLKLARFAEILKQDPKVFSRYSPFFGTTELTVSQIFPTPGDPIAVYTNPLEDAGFDTAIIPILLFDPVNDRFNFGVLEVRYYERDLDL